MRKKFCLPLLALLLAGCGLFGGGQQPQGRTIAPAYAGLADKSLAIVIYVPPATTNEFPGAREEISSFIAAQMREHLPTTRLVNPLIIIDWQNSTLNWYALPETDMGRHFSVDRLLYIQVLTYGTGKVTGFSDLRGHLRAQCRIFDCESPASTAPATAPAVPENAAPPWKGIVEVYWPPARPLDPTQTNEAAVRLRTLESFADQLVRCFYEAQ